MKKKILSKKGMDEKIATILLVGFVIVLLLIAFLWVKSFVKSRASKEIQLSEKQFECKDIAITVTDVTESADALWITVENKKDAKIEKITFRLVGDEQAKVIDSYDALNSIEIKKYELATSNIGFTIANVDIIPWIKVARNNFVPCSQQHVLAIVS